MSILQDEQDEKGLVSTGIEGLDAVLNGGLPRGHFFLVEGNAGAGKTTMGLQFLMAGVRAGENVLYVTLSESEKEIKKIAHSHGWSLDGVTIYEFMPNEDSLGSDDQYSAFHPSDVEFEDSMQNILRQVERVLPTRVVIDSLTEIRLLARDSLRYRRQVVALKLFFANRDCTVILLDERTKDEHDIHLQSVAHGVLILETISREYGRTRRRMQVAKMRGSVYREGYHDHRIVTGGMEVFPRLRRSEYSGEMPSGFGLSGVKNLDSIWNGGLDRGTSTLLLGPAGSGKSSIALTYAITAARAGEFVALLLFEELIHLASKRGAGLNLDPRPWVASGNLLMEQIEPAEMAPGEFVQRVRDMVEKRGARVVIIDSLNGLIKAMPDESHLTLLIRDLLAFLNHRGVLTFIVLAHGGVMGPDMTTPVDLSYLADNVMLFRFFEVGGRMRKAISVIKKRGGGHEDTVRELQMTNEGIAIGDPMLEFRGILSGAPMYGGPNPALRESDGSPNS
jgi:circadian clock protein KaiC